MEKTKVQYNGSRLGFRLIESRQQSSILIGLAEYL
jgi:hypothetical protein